MYNWIYVFRVEIGETAVVYLLCNVAHDNFINFPLSYFLTLINIVCLFFSTRSSLPDVWKFSLIKNIFNFLFATVNDIEYSYLQVSINIIDK